ncbi:hypothetical protein G6F32_014429 [Rhizopus arrhizus]|nr:hypothetical protein G6F32_014429 [Rhizopus arrhizus]
MRDPAPIDIFNPVYTGYVPVTNSISYSGGVNRQTGAYLQDQIALDKWRFTVGGRYDWTKDDTWTQSYTVATDRYGARAPSRVKNEAFSGNAGILQHSYTVFRPDPVRPDHRQAVGSGREVSAIWIRWPDHAFGLRSAPAEHPDQRP